MIRKLESVIEWIKKKRQTRKERLLEKKRKKDLLTASQFEEFALENDRRDVFYSALVKDIVLNNRSSQILKIIFFIVVCLVFVGVTIAGIVTILVIAKKDKVDYSELGVAITGLCSVISAIIILPKTIANHLFPQNGEEVRFNFIKDNQKFDVESPSWQEYDGTYDAEENGNVPKKEEL